jgi:hypothetical protein
MIENAGAKILEFATLSRLVRAEYDRIHASCEHAPADRTECCGVRFDRPCYRWCVNAEDARDH